MIDCEHLLNDLTRRQRNIYEAHDPLFEAVFQSPRLSHVDPDVLESIERDQREFLINRLMKSSSYEWKKMSVKGTVQDVDDALRPANLDRLIDVVIGIVEDRDRGVKA